MYAMFSRLPPFVDYRMPAPHKVTFKVVNDLETFGWFVNDPAVIQISKTLCLDWDKISETMLHEMIHCMLWYNGHKDFDKHDAKFNKVADRICTLYNFNRDEF